MEFLMQVCSFLAAILGIYSFIIFVRIIVSWILFFSRQNGWRSGNGGYGYNQEDPNHPTGLAKFDQVLGRICDPYLNLFKGMTAFRRSNIDFTPLFALVLLNLVKSILGMFAETGKLTIWVVFAIMIDGVWNSVFSFIIFILVVLLFVRYFVGRRNSYSSYNTLNTLDQILDKPVERVYRLFYKGQQVDDQKLVLTSAFFYLVILIAVGIVVNLLVNFLVGL